MTIYDELVSVAPWKLWKELTGNDRITFDYIEYMSVKAAKFRAERGIEAERKLTAEETRAYGFWLEREIGKEIDTAKSCR